MRDRMVIAVLVGFGILAVFRLLDWWFRQDHVAHPLLFGALSIAVWYGISRIVLGWVNYVHISRPEHRDAPQGLRVAIFTTSSPGEPLAMFEKTLAACRRVRYPHTTYLLDDTRDPAFRDVAERNGAVWLELVGLPGAKAGKINAALAQTREDFILVLDPDHVPFPEFLDRVLGHFDDERLGFVQVSQAYYNQPRSFAARGAAEQTYGFYGPVQMGLCGLGGSVAIGANCTFRRAALESIGGHGIGLAEDLVTSIRLHGAGWKSTYVPEVLSRGLVPEDLGSFYRQQIKWARGVYEVAFAELPHVFRGLSWRQRLSYLTIGTFYLFGVTTLLYLVFPYLYLWTGLQPASMRFDEFLANATPVGAAGAALYFFCQRWLCDPRTERGTHWRGLVLKIACWPVFFGGTALAIARANVPYIPTAKEAKRGRFLRLAWPQLTLIAIYAVTVAHVLRVRLFVTSEGALELSSQAVWGMVAFATLPVLLSFGVLYAAWEARRVPAGAAWDSIDVDRLGGDT
ncbi:MAG TPA: cellulose synthase catalytic subunit [Gemmatimonadaceae bacterium]|jgi:cellulose synthase (UDP-forming)|nr:cellulose synthase catalytic subunit [Gemmatimonadaceae bacterium]